MRPAALETVIEVVMNCESVWKIVSHFDPWGRGLDLVCFFPFGFLLVPCKVPLENAILLGYAWEEREPDFECFVY